MDNMTHAQPKILVVDDASEIRAFATECLALNNYAVTTAADGEEAMKLAKSFQFDVVLVDIFMPHKDGIEVVREMSEASPHSKVIAMTSEMKGGPTDYLGVAEALGAVASIAKPFMPDALLDLIADVVAVPAPA